MTFRRSFKQLAINSGLIVSTTAQDSEIEAFFERFREHYVTIELKRVGGAGDGGYLIPDILEKISHCYSPGVADSAAFELELSEQYGIISLMADASVAGPPLDNPNFRFTKRFLGNRTSGNIVTLTDWMSETTDDTVRDLILQMDIEGAEYEVLISEPESTLSKFAVLVIEFHYLDNLFEKHFLRMVTSLFEKLYKMFSICHVHPNNCCGVAEFHNFEVPRVIEVTFLRNDYSDCLKSHSLPSLPHPLDERNVDSEVDIVMPDIWWTTR